MQWKELSALAREMAATPPSDRLHQTKLRLAVSTVYYAMYHALAGSNADLLIGPSETEGSAPEWHRVYAALGGDSAFELMQAETPFPAIPKRSGVSSMPFSPCTTSGCGPRRPRWSLTPPPRPRVGSIEPRWPLPSSFPSIPNNAERLPLSYCRSISPSNSHHRRGCGHAVRSTRFRPLSLW